LLKKIDSKKAIHKDTYQFGWSTRKLEEAFCNITGKESCIYVPSGTLGNQLCIKSLNNGKIKAIVSHNSHIYRDTWDCIEKHQGIKLMPLWQGKMYFNSDDLEKEIAFIASNEIFNEWVGTIVLETPIRRNDNSYIPLEEIKKIHAICKKEWYKLHLDGARLHLHSFYEDTYIQEICSYFDTICISLYKYLHSCWGSVICGWKDFIHTLPAHIKTMWWTSFQSWANTAVALESLENIEKKWHDIIAVQKLLVSGLNDISGIEISVPQHHTNIIYLEFSNSAIDQWKFFTQLQNQDIYAGRKNAAGKYVLIFNETILTRKYEEILSCFSSASIDCAPLATNNS
jgi:threonine aldolase